MKKITIGRGRECDIIIDDSTDTVSRRQAVITFSPFGSMKLYDTSSNGTYANGVKVEKPVGMAIKRGDNINFAHVADLDWEKVRNPYRKIIISLVVMLLAAVIVSVLFIFLTDRISSISDKEMNDKETIVDQNDNIGITQEDSLTLKVPVETPTPGPVRTPAVNKASESNQANTKSRSVSNEVSSNDFKETPEINNNSSEKNLEEAINQR